ncbi:MAG: alpha/beta hydrolase [Rhodothermales bacterium]|nr:alpha/beta hydrolase [Rhodothermales bacterium]
MNHWIIVGVLLALAGLLFMVRHLSEPQTKQGPNNAPRRSFIRKHIRIGLALFWSAVIIWLFVNMQARGLQRNTLESDAAVAVDISDEWIKFSPGRDTLGVGLIFYPGALVEPTAYAPLARSVAEAGYPVVIVCVPLRLAPLQRHRDELTSRTRRVIASGDASKWVVGGHSKGGALAASFAKDFASEIDGLLLVGTSHPRRDDLSSLQIDVTKVYGSEDGLATVDEVNEFANNLPATTTFVLVEGANHSQFGFYGWQPGAGRASISRAEQQRQTIDAIIAQLRRLWEG